MVSQLNNDSEGEENERQKELKLGQLFKTNLMALRNTRS
jgi:hypothetical protein